MTVVLIVEVAFIICSREKDSSTLGIGHSLACELRAGIVKREGGIIVSHTCPGYEQHLTCTFHFMCIQKPPDS